MEGAVPHTAVLQHVLQILVDGAAVERLSKIIREHAMKTVVPKCARC